MSRLGAAFLTMVVASSAWASDRAAPYYGPMQRWHGIGFKFGYDDRTEADGVWRTDASVHASDGAIDMALYRAAERARADGYRYVVFLGGSESRSPGIDSAIIYARPSHEANAPTGCRSKRAAGCYTADVAEVLRILGGPGGTQPGVAIADHRDSFGREVFRSGYGTGGIVALMPGGVASTQSAWIVDGRLRIISAEAARGVPSSPPPPPVQPLIAGVVPVKARSPVSRPASPSSDTRFERAMKASQPIHGRDPNQGWTISD